jgi:phosphate transport system permease protein
VPRRLSDRVGVLLAWATGLALCATIATIVGWLAYNGLGNVSWDFLTSSPAPGSLQSGVSGGILDPLVGSLFVVVIGILFAFPLGVGTAIFLAEYRRPLWFARIVDVTVDMIFGVPSVVFAMFGLAVFGASYLVFLSGEVSTSGQATAVSFIVSGLMLALIAFPPIVRATESAIRTVPNHQREAAYALGKGKLTTVRRIVVPGARSGIITGVMLGVGRIVGDTAIAIILLGGTVLEPMAHGWWHPDQITSTLRGSGSTLTTYILYSSPAGEGNTAGKAYGAALVLMVLILVVNGLVRLVGRKGRTA